MIGPFPARLSLAKRWALASGGVLTEMNHDPFDRIAVSCDRAMSRTVLADWWDVKDPRNLRERLEWLRDEGHSAQLQTALSEFEKLTLNCDTYEKVEPTQLGRFLVANSQQLRTTMLKAWDGSRLVCVARWGFSSGYIDEKEAWKWIMSAALSLRGRFASWKELGDDFLLGYRYWSLDQTPIPSVMEGHSRLMKSGSSPWKQIAWEINPELLVP